MKIKTLEKIGEASDDYGTYATVFRNLAHRSTIVHELMETLNEPYEIHGDGSDVVICETVPRCYHQHDCCACVISRRFIVRTMFTECHTCINI
jgi:hypothetical protein